MSSTRCVDTISFLELPLEMKKEIVSHLPYEGVVAVFTTNSYLAKICNTRSFWQDLLLLGAKTEIDPLSSPRSLFYIRDKDRYLVMFKYKNKKRLKFTVDNEEDLGVVIVIICVYYSNVNHVKTKFRITKPDGVIMSPPEICERIYNYHTYPLLNNGSFVVVYYKQEGEEDPMRKISFIDRFKSCDYKIHIKRILTYMGATNISIKHVA